MKKLFYIAGLFFALFTSAYAQNSTRPAWIDSMNVSNDGGTSWHNVTDFLVTSEGKVDSVALTGNELEFWYQGVQREVGSAGGGALGGAYLLANTNTSNSVDTTRANYKGAGSDGNFTDRTIFDNAIAQILVDRAAGQRGWAVIELLPGTYYMDAGGVENAQMSIDQMDSVIVLGYGAEIKTPAADNAYGLKFTDCNYVQVHGLSIDGNGANQTNLGRAFSFRESSNIVVTDCWAYNTRSNSFEFFSSNSIITDNCMADSSIAGRGFVYDFLNDASGPTYDFILSNSISRYHGLATIRFQESRDGVIVGNNFIQRLNDLGTKRSATIANDAQDTDILDGLLFVANKWEYGAEIEMKGANGHIGFFSNMFIGTKFTLGPKDFPSTGPDTLGYFVWVGNTFDFRDDPDSRYFNSNNDPDWDWPQRAILKDNIFKGRGSISYAIYWDSPFHLTLDGNEFEDIPATGVYVGALVRRPNIRNNVMYGTDNGGANSQFLDLLADSAMVVNNHAYDVKVGMDIRSANNYIMNNHLFGGTISGDSAMVFYAGGQGQNFVLRNTMLDWSVEMTDEAGPNELPSVTDIWNNVGTLGRTSANKWTLGSRGATPQGRLVLNDTTEIRLTDSLVVLNRLHITDDATPSGLGTNAGGENLRPWADETIQLVPQADEQGGHEGATEFLNVGLNTANTNIMVWANGTDNIYVDDSWSANPDDTTRVLGLTSTTAWNRLTLRALDNTDEATLNQLGAIYVANNENGGSKGDDLRYMTSTSVSKSVHETDSYGSMGFNGESELISATQDVSVHVTNGTTDMWTLGPTSDYTVTADKLEGGASGDYEITVALSYSSPAGSPDEQWELQLVIDNVETEYMTFDTFDANRHLLSCTFIVTLAGSADIELAVENKTDNDDLTVHDGMMTARRLLD